MKPYKIITLHRQFNCRKDIQIIKNTLKMKKLLVIAVMLLGTNATFAKNVVPVYTSCGKVAYIDTERTTIENTLGQVMEIERILCGDGEDGDDGGES